MKTMTLNSMKKWFALVAAIALPMLASATPYATLLTNNAGVISFRLNESGFVTIITTNSSGNLVTNDIGNRTQGLTATNIGNLGNFTVIVSKTNNPGWVSGGTLQISVDGTNTVTLATNLTRFNSPRGVAVNKNPASPFFGRIYVANSAAGTATRSVGDGFYLLNADGTDAVGQGNTARTAGFGTTITNDLDANFPGRLEVGADDNVYVSSQSSNSVAGQPWSTLQSAYVITPDALANTVILTNGRTIGSVIPFGTTNAGNLSLVTVDGDNAGIDTFVNNVKRVPVNSGPFPINLAEPTNSVTEGGLLSVAGVFVDAAVGPDGKYYALQYRLVDADPNLLVFDPAVDADLDGLADLVWNSRGETIGTLGQSRDYLFGARAVAISPDGNYMAVLREDNQIFITPLTNGVPVIAQRKIVVNSSATVLARDIAFDAAGNLYTVSSGQGLLRIYSPGYTTIATSSTLGTFSYTNIVPAAVVSVSGTITNASEPSTDGEFTFTRSGDTNLPLTVFYTVGGTATV
jgi:WD40 repeat protein